MAHNDEQLIELIAQQVLALIRQQQDAPGSASAAAAPHRADVQPPAGVCSGDYSKFTERRVLANTTEKPIALHGIVTAQQLEAAISASPDKVALLAPGARLTPLASDYARQYPQKVRRGDAGSIADNAAGQVSALPWLWWAEGHCSAVQAVVARLGNRLAPSGAGRSEVGQVQMIRDLASALRAKTVAGGLMFVSNAARAALFANRCASLRAVVGTCAQAVEQGITQLGVNLLVIEYPHTSAQQIEAMVDAMIRQVPKSLPHVERQLADMQRK